MLPACGYAYPRGVTSTRPVLVVDLGAQSAQTLARRVRELKVYSQIVPPADAATLLEHDPIAVIFAGGEGALPAESAAELKAQEVPVLVADGVPGQSVLQGFIVGAGVYGRSRAAPQRRSRAGA